MKLRNALLLFFVSCSLVALATAQENLPPDLTLEITGRLLGYYRVPDLQPADFQPTCAWPDPKAGTPASLFLGYYPRGNAVRVGMGDNFAVELGARTWGADPEHLQAKLRNPHLADGWQSNPSAAIGDNVGCFLALAHYDAIVPGKEDFYFGPERLRQIALRLAAIPEVPNADDKLPHPVPVLAANLVVQTSYIKDPDKIPDSVKHLPFTPGWPDGVKSNISDHGTILPFAQLVILDGLAKATKTLKEPKDQTMSEPVPFLCRAKTADDPDSIFVAVHGGGSQCNQRQPLVKEICAEKNECDSKTYFKLGSPTSPLEVSGKGSNGNYGLCIEVKGKKLPYCVRFTVLQPFLQQASCITPACFSEPYVYLADKKTVIFGVVDPDLGTLVGRDNLSWRNADPELQTQVAAIDPLEALAQAMQDFEEKNCQGDPHCKKLNLRRILLAQMSRGKAEELAAHLKSGGPSFSFDAVIAQTASDFDHATQSGTLQVNKSGNDYGFKPVVITPWRGDDAPFCTAYARGEIAKEQNKQQTEEQKTKQQEKKERIEDDCNSSLFRPVRNITIADTSDADTSEIVREFETLDAYQTWPELAGYQQKVHCGEAEDKGKGKDGKNRVKGCPDLGTPSRHDFQENVLAEMRSRTNADIAMLQSRDFYFDWLRKTGPLIERVLWRADRLQVMHVTGDALLKTLKESDKFDQAESDPVHEAEEKGRGLVYLGIQKTEDENFLVGGVPIDKNRVYTIAAGNHIAAGDTGYPELSGADDSVLADGKLPSPADNRAVGQRISELACPVLPLALRNCVDDADGIQPAPRRRDLLYASSSDTPPQAKPGKIDELLKVWVAHSLDEHALLADPDPESPETQAQNEPRWRFSLKQFSFKYTLNANNLSEADRQKYFNGFTEPGVSAANAHSWADSVLLESVRSGRFLDEYARLQLDYSSSITKSIPPALAVVSRDKNRGQADAGLYYHPFTFQHLVWPFGLNKRKESLKSGFVFEPFRLDTPLARELADIGVNSQTPQRIGLDRTQRVLVRTGYRAETSASHLEAGFEGGWQIGSLGSITTDQGNCSPSPTLPFSTCLANLTPPVTGIHEHVQTLHRKGFYLDWNWQSPLPFLKTWTNQIQAQAEWFPFTGADDNSSDTRKQLDFNESIKIPIFASLSFQPGIEHFIYRNEFGAVSLRRWTPSASLTWSFDRFSGESWWKAIRHQSGSAAGQ